MSLFTTEWSTWLKVSSLAVNCIISSFFAYRILFSKERSMKQGINFLLGLIIAAMAWDSFT